MRARTSESEECGVAHGSAVAIMRLGCDCACDYDCVIELTEDEMIDIR
jgi:hypothetical protein